MFLVCQASWIIADDIYGVGGVDYAEIVKRFFVSPAGRVITPMSPRTQTASVTTCSVQVQGPFPTPLPSGLDILRHVVLRSCQLLPLGTRSQQGSKVHPVRNRGHENLHFASHCRECIAVFAAGNPGHRPLDIYYRY
jgi:hypothetical protein